MHNFAPWDWCIRAWTLCRTYAELMRNSILCRTYAELNPMQNLCRTESYAELMQNWILCRTYAELNPMQNFCRIQSYAELLQNCPSYKGNTRRAISYNHLQEVTFSVSNRQLINRFESQQYVQPYRMKEMCLHTHRCSANALPFEYIYIYNCGINILGFAWCGVVDLFFSLVFVLFQ